MKKFIPNQWLFKLKGFLLYSLMVLINACSSGKQSFEKGDYDRAVYQAVNRLQKDPNNKKALTTLQQAYRYAREDHQSRIKNAINSSEVFHWETVIQEYESMNSLIESVSRCPSCRQII